MTQAGNRKQGPYPCIGDTLTTDNIRKVLVIDDETATLNMFRLFLTAYGYEALVAEDGKSGLELLKAHHPEVVFTDLKMPTMDGFEVLKQVKRLAPRTEVVVITGHGDMDLVVQALNLDATDFINKPIGRSALEASLRRASDRLQHPMPKTGRLTLTTDQGISRITIEGTLRHENREQLLQCCNQARNMPDQSVLFHFLENAAVDGPGIAELINCLSNFQDNNQPVAVIGLSENFKVIFEMVGVSRFAHLYDREADALKALKKS